MRVWDIDVKRLCNKHLIAQHHEIHCIYNIITQDKRGFAHHPEVMRWRKCVPMLVLKHEEAANQMVAKGMNHKSDIIPLGLPLGVLPPYIVMPEPWQSIPEQVALLQAKGCDCNLEGLS